MQENINSNYTNEGSVIVKCNSENKGVSYTVLSLVIQRS